VPANLVLFFVLTAITPLQ